MGSSESKSHESKNEGVINNNLVLENEIKTTNNDEEMLLKIIVGLFVFVLICMILRSIIKYSKKQQVRETLLANYQRNQPQIAPVN